MDETNKKILRSKSERSATKNSRKNLRLFKQINKNRHDSLGAIEEIVQCGICLEKLTDPRMLPCQHTFCLTCLQLVVANLLNKPINSCIQIHCPICQKHINFINGVESVNALPKNLYIDSLLKVIEGSVSPSIPKVPDYRCSKCQTISEQQLQICQHCIKIFCNICWNQHLTELESNLFTLIKQVEESEIRLEHKLENLENRCNQLNENINQAVQEKIELIHNLESKAFKEVASIKSEGKILHDIINVKITDLKTKLTSKSLGTHNKVAKFMKFHRETSDLLNEIHHYGEAHLIFDPDTFKLDQDTEGIYSEVDETELVNITGGGGASIDNEGAMEIYYKTRQFTPILIWNKCPRPASVAIPPWDNTKLYIAATDSRTVLILDKEKVKLVGRLTSPELLSPHGLAFSKERQEIYVSDKWKHCIHVFNSSGDYLKHFLSKGTGTGRVRSPDGLAIGDNGELIICDSGNDRIVVINSKTGEYISTIGVINGKTNLNMPTGVAVSGDKIIVADTGNHRIKIFNLKNGEKLLEFGSFGRNRGQFRSAEVVTVDSHGFILVGDGDNARIQVFKLDGTLIRIFGDSDIGWVSGIFVTDDMKIITTDGRRRTLRIF